MVQSLHFTMHKIWTRSLNFHGKSYLPLVPPLRLLSNSSVNSMSTLQFSWECPTVNSWLFASVIIRPLPVTHRRCGSKNPQQVFNSTGEKYSPVMLYWCARNRLREQEDRDIIKCTVLLLSLCPRVHVPTDSPVYFLPPASFGLSPAARHGQETELPRKSLLHLESLPHFLSSTLSFPGCLLCAACQPVAHVAPHWKEAQKYFDLKLSWQHQCLDQKDSGGGMRRPNCSPQRLLRWHDKSQPCPFLLPWAQTFIHCADCWTVSIKGI